MSMQRHCFIYRSNNGMWYLELGDREHARRDDSVTYGPFKSESAVREEMKFHSNPGSSMTDNSGNREPPTLSPNGTRVRPPTQNR
jgi:hypothetical protein